MHVIFFLLVATCVVAYYLALKAHYALTSSPRLRQVLAGVSVVLSIGTLAFCMGEFWHLGTVFGPITVVLWLFGAVGAYVLAKPEPRHNY